MTFTLKVRRSARRDLVELHRWIRQEADASIADAYVGRLDAFMRTLCDFPHRGTPRGHVSPGLRTVTFERGMIVAYKINARQVEILRVLNGARNWPRLLRP